MIFSYLHNHASRQLRKGEEEFWGKTHRLNRFGVEHEIFTRRGVMLPTQFNNIVTAACKMNDFYWACSFVTTQSRYLREDIRAPTALLANALILFEKKDFHQVLELLKKADPVNLDHAIRARAMMLRCY